MIVISFPTPGMEQGFLKDVQEQFGQTDLYRKNIVLTKMENGLGGESAVNCKKDWSEDLGTKMHITKEHVSQKEVGGWLLVNNWMDES